MPYRFALITPDADHVGIFETERRDWQTGDVITTVENVRYRVVSVIPGERIGEFVEGREIDGVIAVEPL